MIAKAPDPVHKSKQEVISSGTFFIQLSAKLSIASPITTTRSGGARKPTHGNEGWLLSHQHRRNIAQILPVLSSRQLEFVDLFSGKWVLTPYPFPMKSICCQKELPAHCLWASVTLLESLKFSCIPENSHRTSGACSEASRWHLPWNLWSLVLHDTMSRPTSRVNSPNTRLASVNRLVANRTKSRIVCSSVLASFKISSSFGLCNMRSDSASVGRLK